MSSKDAKLQVVVRSEKVARIVEFEIPVTTVYGRLGTTRRRARVYDYVLDERQARALRQARELASSSGLSFEVTDLTQEGAFKRFLRAGSSRISEFSLPRPSSSARVAEERAVS